MQNGEEVETDVNYSEARATGRNTVRKLSEFFHEKNKDIDAY